MSERKPLDGPARPDGAGEAAPPSAVGAGDARDEAPPPGAEAPPPPAVDHPPPLAVDAAELAELRARAARADELYEALARQQAECENLRRRMRQEREEQARYAAERLLAALLPVVDNLERALQGFETEQAEQGAASGSGVGGWRRGVELTLRQFRDVLSREGVTPIAAVGEAFDPRLHEAVVREETDEHPDGIVLEEFQKGYRLHDRVLRPSMVKVSSRSGGRQER